MDKAKTRRIRELIQDTLTRKENIAYDDLPTIWVGIKIKNTLTMSELCEHLSMNGYTFDTNAEDVIFIVEEEQGYLETILKDRNIDYTVL